ncbi:MAG: HlyD family efflux transporter periplasmic adaptor subunit [Acetobacteraceae bacterium]|nr:HlyD family efflux transporter periplasmic adaptor subunit [Acetobacteraceae bacterium]
MPRLRSRTWLISLVALLVGGGLAASFWPRALAVDIGRVARADMRVTIDEEARTRVRNTYVVSAPIDGRLLRVAARPGDAVEGGRTVVARMLPVNPPALDQRSREQARAAITAAEAAVAAARAALRQAIAEKDFTDGELQRKRVLARRGVASEASFDEAERAARGATAALDAARATVAMREADLANQRAQLISFAAADPQARSGAPTLGGEDEATIPLTAPVSGRILRLLQESATTVTAGTPILEIGDTSNDLEVVAELLSTDAVQVAPGDGVMIRKWGGTETLRGMVARIEPWAFTKTSALGVEEQRVRVIIAFTDPAAVPPSLGHGFRVEVQIIVWEAAAALTVPSNALFRLGDGWAIFAVVDGRAQARKVGIGRNNGTLAEVTGGAAEGTEVVLYPPPGLADGARVARRLVPM